MAKRKGRNKVKKVMKEFKSGKLKTSAGQKVTNPKQAVAIAMSEAGMSRPENAMHKGVKMKLE